MYQFSIFSSTSPCYAPTVGLTEVQLCFTPKIICNSKNVCQICSRFDAKTFLWTPNGCSKFQPDWCKCLWVTEVFVEYAKRKTIRKTKNFFGSLIDLISSIAKGILCKFGMWPSLSGGHLHDWFGAIQIGHHIAIYPQKLHLSSFCQYTHSIACPVFLGHKCGSVSWSIPYNLIKLCFNKLATDWEIYLLRATGKLLYNCKVQNWLRQYLAENCLSSTLYCNATIITNLFMGEAINSKVGFHTFL